MLGLEKRNEEIDEIEDRRLAKEGRDVEGGDEAEGTG
jgi:hypothetical protein